MSTFPTQTYVKAQSKWIGRDHIVAPTLAQSLSNWTLIKGKKVLDVGCGAGHIGKQILANGAREVHGLDSSEEMVQDAQRNYGSVSGLSFQQGSISETVIPGFDVAVAVFSLHFMESEQQLIKAIQNISNSLKSDGVLVAIVPNGIPQFNPTREEGVKFGAAIHLEQGEKLYDGRRIEVQFFENAEVVGKAEVTFFFNETYEKILKDAGFRKVEFLPPTISEEGLQLYGEEFFHSYHSPPKDIVIRAFK